MKKFNNIVIGITAIVVLSGCSGVDEDKLAQLTGNQSFKNIKESYQIAVTSEDEDSIEVYEYWLDENGAKADPSFDSNPFKKNIKLNLKKAIEELKTKMAAIRDNPNQVRYRDIKGELEMMYMVGRNIKFVREVYVPFLEKTKDEVLKRND